MRSSRLLLRCLLVSAVILSPIGLAMAADGIKPGVPFKVPFFVAGQNAINRATVSVDAAGKATLHVLYVKSDDILEATYALTRQDGPDPKPEPDPDPVPPPPAELWGIVVEESSARTPEQAAIYASPKVRALFDDERFRLIDKDAAVDADLRPYLTRALQRALPVLFLAGADGTIYYEGAPPDTIDAMLVLIEKTKKGGRP